MTPFEEHRFRLRAVAYRMLGSTSEADDVLQEAWLRYERADTEEVRNLGGWLTTVVARVCLNHLRARASRREDALDTHVPDPIVDPEHEVLLGEQVGLALQVVLGTLSPAERLAFVLHDLFSVPFDEIAQLIERSPAATRQLASRARRRVRQEAPPPDPDRAAQRAVVDAFFAAARAGDLEGLVAVLHPDVVLRSDAGSALPSLTRVLRGARTVAGQAVLFHTLAPHVRPAWVHGAAGAIVVSPARPMSVMAFTVVGGTIVRIDVLADPERLAALGLST